MPWFYISKIYSAVYGCFKKMFGIQLRGIGYILRKVKRDYVITVSGKQMYFNHKVAGCYVRLINGVYHEPETHLFLERIIDAIDFKIGFIDVGANVGEMIIDIARFKKVKEVVGFEPYIECALACKRSVALNGYENVRIVAKALSDKAKTIKFCFNNRAPNASGLAHDENKDCASIEATTLDDQFSDYQDTAILLIDVEGAEPLVLSGGSKFIAECKPLIIFEYNMSSNDILTLRTLELSWDRTMRYSD